MIFGVWLCGFFAGAAAGVALFLVLAESIL